VKCRCDSAARVAEMPTESTWQQCVVTRCYPSKHWHTKTVETRAGRSVGREIIAASRRCTLQSQHHLRVSCALRLVPSRCRSFSRVLQTRPVKVEVTLRYVTRDVATCCGDRTVTPPLPGHICLSFPVVAQREGVGLAIKMSRVRFPARTRLRNDSEQVVHTQLPRR